MKKGMEYNFGYGKLGFVVIVLISLIWNGCSKEEFGVLDTPLDELQNSFYELADGTIELNLSDYNDLLINITIDELEVKKEGVFGNVKIGDHVLTSPSLPYESLIWRKVINVTDNGANLILRTINANPVEAFNEYYFDSRFPLVPIPRDPETFSDIPEAGVNEMFSNIATEPTFSMTFKGGLNGTPGFRAIHPHTAYRIFQCQGDKKCFDDKGKVDVKGGGVNGDEANMIYDFVDKYYGNKLNADINKNGLYTIEIADFGLTELGVTYGTTSTTGGTVALGKDESAEQFDAKIKAAIQRKSNKTEDEALNIKYFPTPIIVWGMRITIPMSPLVTFDYEASMSMDLVLNFPNKLNVEFGHIDAFKGIRNTELEFDLSLKLGDKEVSPAKFFESPSLGFYAGVKGKATTNIGVGIGAAVTVGAAESFGVSLGGMFELTNYYELSGEAGVRIPDILADNPFGMVNVFGEVCFDTGIDYNISLFTDSNLGIFGGDAFDKKYTVPKESFGLGRISVLQFIEPYYQDKKGVCIDYTQCSSVSMDFMNIGKGSSNNVFEFKFTAAEGLPITYSITLDLNEATLWNTAVGTTKQKLGDFTFGKDERHVSISDISEIQASIASGRLKILIEPSGLGCSKDFSAADATVLNDCGDQFYGALQSVSIINPTLDFDNIFGRNVKFYNVIDCETICDTLGKVPTLSQLKTKLEGLACLNPTGYAIFNIGGPANLVRDEIYAWITPDQNTPERYLAKITLKSEGDKNEIDVIKAEPNSQSTFAPCICQNN